MLLGKKFWHRRGVRLERRLAIEKIESGWSEAATGKKQVRLVGCFLGKNFGTGGGLD